MSEIELSFVESLVLIQKDLKAPKGQTNNFGKYKYRSAEDILEAVKPLNAQEGLLLTLSDEPVLIGDWHYIRATATITNGKDSHVVTAYARESLTKKGMDDSQITGTASSYARKYALNGLYLIDDTKDADTDEYQNTQQRQQPEKKVEPSISESQKAGLKLKWSLMDGKEEVFEPWLMGELSKGKTHKELDLLLAQKLVEKQEKENGQKQ